MLELLLPVGIAVAGAGGSLYLAYNKNDKQIEHRLTRVETKVDYMDPRLVRIEDKVDKLVQHMVGEK